MEKEWRILSKASSAEEKLGSNTRYPSRPRDPQRNQPWLLQMNGGPGTLTFLPGFVLEPTSHACPLSQLGGLKWPDISVHLFKKKKAIEKQKEGGK